MWTNWLKLNKTGLPGGKLVETGLPGGKLVETG